MQWQFYWNKSFFKNFHIGSSRALDEDFGIYHVIRWIGPFQFVYWSNK